MAENPHQPTTNGPSGLKRRRLYEDVVEHLAARIHDGTYGPGQELPSERALMAELGVGRPAIREALFALQTMGVLALRTGERAKVIEPTHDVVLGTIRGPVQRMMAQPGGLRHFQHARVFFEVGIVREAARIARPADLDRLAQALEANRDATGTVTRFEQTDVDFHYVLAQIPQNPVFLAMHDAMFDWLYAQRSITLRVPNQIAIAYREHEEIFDAVRDGNPDRAERALRAHLARGHALYWQIMGHETAAMPAGTAPITGRDAT